MYLNLDLLYNIDTYLYPLFYYMGESVFEVYSPMTKKGVYIEDWIITYFDYISRKYYENQNDTITIRTIYNKFNFTESHVLWDGEIILDKCIPFKLKKQDILFLKSNKRIN